MQDPLSEVRQALSAERFAEYRKTAIDDTEAVGRYLWNTRLCESLYPTIQFLEVALRNSLHSSISTKYGAGPFKDIPCWLDNDPPILEPDELKSVARAKRTLVEQGKPLQIGRVVAELNFGFWTSLLDLRYERFTNIFWPQLLQPTFPFMPRRIRTRKIVSSRFNNIRHLRNRVSHHEPIWHWKDLPDQHAQLVEALSWISSDLVVLARRIDRFNEVFREGWDKYRTGVLG